MTDSCASCFYFRSSTCRVNPPQTMQGGFPGWPSVAGADWCGYGADEETLASFSTGVTGGLSNPSIDVQNSVSTASWTVSASAPSGGADGNFWLRVVTGVFTLSQKQAGSWVQIATWTSA